jgi:phage shock protein PspC (stress-responsive transcriptional regulator)
MERIKGFFEVYAFGVCTLLGNTFKLPTSLVRLFFIYLTFVAIGSPVIAMYLAFGFFLKFKEYFFERRKRVWDLY